MRNYHHRQGKIGYGFDMKRRIKIRRYNLVGKLPNNNLAKFQTNWSRGCWLGVQNAWTTCLNIHIEKQGNIEFRQQWDKWHLGPEPEAEHVPVSILVSKQIDCNVYLPLISLSYTKTGINGTGIMSPNDVYHMLGNIFLHVHVIALSREAFRNSNCQLILKSSQRFQQIALESMH